MELKSRARERLGVTERIAGNRTTGGLSKPLWTCTLIYLYEPSLEESNSLIYQQGLKKSIGRSEVVECWYSVGKSLKPVRNDKI